MTTSPARRLIVAYAALTLLLDFSVFLPGGLEYGDEGATWGDVWGLIGAVGFQALIVWPLWHSSSDRDVAWVFAVAFAVLYVAMTVEQAPLATAVLWFVFSISQLAILWTRPIRAFVWAVGDSPAELLRQ